MLVDLQGRNLESQIEKATEHEKKYEWLQAVECYRKASELVLAEKNVLRAADLNEKTSFCYYRAALQATNNNQFISRIEKAIYFRSSAVGYLQKISDKNIEGRMFNSKAMIRYYESWLEAESLKRIALLNEWWNLKTKALKVFEVMGDKIAVAKICNDMMEGSVDCRFWLGSTKEDSLKIRMELISLGDYAIEILEENEDVYELARAYCWTSWCCLTFSSNLDVEEEIVNKGIAYAKKAIEYSQKTYDAWLIGWSNNSVGTAEFIQNRSSSAIEALNRQIDQGKIAKDNYLIGIGKFNFFMNNFAYALTIEDPNKSRKVHQQNVKIAQEVIHLFQIINLQVWNAFYLAGIAFIALASIEPNQKIKHDILLKAVVFAKQGVEQTKDWVHSAVPSILNCYTWALYELSRLEKRPDVKTSLLEEALNNAKKSSSSLEKYPQNKFFQAYNQNWKALIKASLSDLTQEKNIKIDLLKDSVVAIENCRRVIQTHLEKEPLDFRYSKYGDFLHNFGRIYRQLYLLTKDRSLLTKAIEIYTDAINYYNKINLITKEAESYWQKAKLHDHLGKENEATQDYEAAAKAYSKAAERIPQLKEFYDNYSLYMQAWSEIELAQYNHSRENYLQAKINYEKAAALHQKLDDWNYLSPNYFAWANLEKAEESSRKEKPQEAIYNFQEAIDNFKRTETNIKVKINENPTNEEKDLMIRILKASDLRQTYCQARILMEEAKLLDREGRFLDSSAKYGDASQKISAIVDKVDNDVESKELEYVAILCRAWEKMANAEETTSYESYFEAAELFEKAKEYCYTKKASLWALGNSNFCRGLAAGLQYKTSLDLADHAKAKGYIKTASNDYLQAGFTGASEYAKATQRLFDAYVMMNQAEGEINQEKRAKQYQMVENLLQLAAGSFMKAKQPEKTTQVQEILDSVREEKTLAVSLSQVMQAPNIASSTVSFSAPSPTNESSVGLEKFEHANVQANLVTTVKQVKVGESFCLAVEFVNAGREPALLMRVEDFVPSGFVVVKKPEIYRIDESCLNMKGKQLAPLKLVEVKLTLQASKKGEYQLNPMVHYLDELGQNKSLQLKTLEIKVEEVLLENRVSTGTLELDSLLLGGIPEEYAVALSGPPCDEREMIVNNFLRSGVTDEISFYITTEANNLQILKKPNFYLFLCNPKPKVEVPDRSNVFKLQGKTDLNNLGIALTKAYRSLNQNVVQPKRLCIEILSEVLEDYGSKTTRKWISDLITNYGTKGFTILAVINPAMHPPDQATAVLDLFDGEISILHSTDPLDCKKSILVKKLRNQDYIKNPICLR